MKGTPRPVSLKTDTIKHRNRSKGDKKLKEGQPLKGKAKKAAGNASRSSSIGPTGVATPASSRLQGLHEADEEGDTSIDDTRSDNGSVLSAYQGYGQHGGLMGTSQRSRGHFDLLHAPNGAHPSTQPPQSLDARAQSAKSQEMAAAMALAGAHQQHQQQSPTVNGRAPQHPAPRYTAPAPYQPYPNNIAAQVNSAFAARQARDMAAFSFASQRHQSQSVSSSLANSPVSSTASTSHIPSSAQQPSVPAQTAQLPLPQPTHLHSYRDWSPKPLSGSVDARKLSVTPTDTPQRSPQRSPLSTNMQQAPADENTNRRDSLTSTSDSQLRVGPSPTGIVASSSASSAQLPSIQQTPYTSMRSGYTAADVDRERQKARLEQLFAEAGQRLSEGASGKPIAQQESPGQTASMSSSGRASAVHHNSASYKPYDRSLSRSSSRPGRLPGEPRQSAVTAATSRQTVHGSAPRTMRPGSSASSSGDSAEQKRAVGGLTSPAHTVDSPRLAGIPDIEHENMAVDGQADDLHALHTGPSPPFGVQASALGLEPGAASERRGRSTTRKMRDGEYSDSVAYELGALRMRDLSRASSYSHSRSQSPAQLPKLSSYLAGHVEYQSLPGSRDSSGGGATIKTGDLDDGIVRNSVTHRPISDLRASQSPASGQTLPSLSEALSSGSSSRSASGPRSMSRQSAARRPMSLKSAAMQEESNGHTLPALMSNADEVARLNIRIRELEFINGLMEGRLHDLESKLAATSIQTSHGPDCSCRCSGQNEQDQRQGADRLKHELATHGIGGMSEQQCRDLFELLVLKKGYRAGDLL